MYGNLRGCSICTSTEEATPLGGQWTMIFIVKLKDLKGLVHQKMLQHFFVGKGCMGVGWYGYV